MTLKVNGQTKQKLLKKQVDKTVADKLMPPSFKKVLSNSIN